MKREGVGAARAWRGRAAGWIIGGLLCSTPGPAVAQELHGLFDTSYSHASSHASGGAGSQFDSVQETLDVNWNKQITPVLDYRLTLRAEHGDGSNAFTLGGTTVKTTSSVTLVEPRLEFNLASPGYALTTGMRLREIFTDDSQESPFNVTELNPYLRFSFTPEGLPSLGVTVDNLRTFDDRNPRATDQDNRRYTASVAYTIQDLRLNYTFSRQVLANDVQGQTTTQNANFGSVSYTTGLFQNTLAVQADLLLNSSTTTDEFIRPGSGEIGAPLSTGLSAPFDPTPANSQDAPVVQAPALVSGSANIALDVFTAVGFGLAVPQTINQIGISLRADAPFVFPPNFSAFIAFRVFATDDPTLINWTEVVGVTQAFDTTQNKLTLTFGPTTARSFKAWVAVNDFGALIKATRIAASAIVDTSVRSTFSRSSRGGTVNLGLTYTPVAWFTAAYNGSMSLTEQDPDSIQTTSGSHNLTLTARPHPLVVATASGQYTYSTINLVGAVDTSQTQISASLGWTPLPTLSSTLTFSRSEDRQDGNVSNRVNVASLNAAARVFPELTVDSTYSIGTSQNFIEHRDVFGQDFSLRLTAYLTQAFSVTGNYGLAIRDSSPPLTGQDAVTVGNTFGGSMAYTLNRVVNLSARWDYTLTTDGWSLAQQYRADWSPTQRTSIFLSYTNTRGSFTSVETNAQAVSVSGRWSVTRIMDVGVDYTYGRTSAGRRVQDAQSIIASANLRF